MEIYMLSGNEAKTSFEPKKKEETKKQNLIQVHVKLSLCVS